MLRMLLPGKWLLVVLLVFVAPHDAGAQFDVLKSLFGHRTPVAAFTGQQQLSEARAAAEQGDWPKSAALLREAMQTVTVAWPAEDPVAQSVTAQLLDLSRLWNERHGPPELIANALLDVVLPPKTNEVRLYPLPWQSSFSPWNGSLSAARDPKPQSIAAELVSWNLRAKQLERLRSRLDTVRQAAPDSITAAVLDGQLAVAEGNEPAANRALAELTAKAPTAADLSALQLHWQAVAAALRRDGVEAAGLTLLEATLDRWDALVPQDNGITNSPSMRLTAARRHMRAGRIEDGVRLARAVAARPVNQQPYGAEFGEHLQRLQTAEAASVLLDGGRIEEALELIGPLVDVPTPRYAMYYPGPNLAALLGRELQRRPAAERYALLHRWVLPAGDRTTVRDLTDFVPWDRPPGDVADPLPAGGLLGDVYSTSWDLVRTAIELGRLNELRKELAAMQPPTPAVQSIRALAEVMSDGGRSPATQELLATLLAATTQGIPAREDQQKTPFPMLTLAVASEVARFPQWDDGAQKLLEQLIEHTKRLQWDRPRAHLRMTWAEVIRRRSGGDASQPVPTGLPDVWEGLVPRLWVPAGIETAAQHAGGSLPDVWLAQDGSVQHLTGPYDSHLYFQYPLAGNFEIALDCREGGWAEGYTGYGGALFAVNGYIDQASLRAPGGTGYQPGPSLTNLLHRNPWNAQRIQVRNGHVRFLANGQLIHEDRPGPTSPWFSLGSDWGRTPIFRNLKFSGTPEIPREVPLLSDVRLRGWVSETLGESRRDPLADQPEAVVVNGLPVAVMEGPTDWFYRDGELQSPQRDSFWPGGAESWMFYHRPLCPKETVRYEFFYHDGKFEAHPTIGRRAFVLKPDGVTTHWMTDGPSEVRGLTVDNGRHRPQRLPLRADDWNVVELTMQTDAVKVRLNGELIVTEPLSARDGRTFGVYHDTSQTSVRVRNAVLRGDWPAEFTTDLRTAIEQPEPKAPPEDRRFATAILSEPFFADNAYAVYRRALEMDAAARYDYLHRWVMPGPTHANLRMASAFTPTHPAPPALADNPIDAANAEARQAIDGRMVQTGGSFVSPAILLVLSAAELNKLDELDAAVYELRMTTPAAARGQSAMLGIIALLQDRPAEAINAVWECARLLLEPGPVDPADRWSEPALCSLAILHPATRQAAYELLDRIQTKQLQAGQPGTPEFNRYVRQLYEQTLYLMHGGDPATFGAQPRLSQWRAVPQPCARTRGAGIPIAAFDSLTGELALRGGHDFDMAYFQSPLRGNFEIRLRLSQYDYRELMPLVAGICNTLQYTHQRVKLQSIRTPVQEVTLSEPISPRIKSWADYRIVVQDGRYHCYVGDQLLYEADVGSEPDPWIAVVGWAGQSSRAARKVIITGSPTIPDELELLKGPDLRNWLADYYGASPGQSPYPWRLENGELRCDQTVIRNAVPGRLKIENIIRYHRPMLEDGEISYEFYYDPDQKIPEPADPQRNFGPFNQPQPRMIEGQTVVHPALDRLVCLLEPDGVKVHWLTDGRYDRTGLLPGNLTVESDRGPQTLPLKPQNWNSVRFAVTGDTLSITLNDVLVFTRPIEPTNLRHFGLFHYVNESTARVRNVRYRGDWPKTLPPVDEQELARGPEQFAEFRGEELPARSDYDFTNSRFEPAGFAYHWSSQASAYVKPTAAGLRMTLPAGEAKPQVAGVHPKLRLSGDFVATLEYSDLKTAPVKEAWGTGLSFKVALDQSYEAGFEVRQWKESNGTSVMWQIASPHKQYLYHSEGSSAFPDSGRLRIARRGPVLYFLTAPLGSDDFRLLSQRPIGTNDIKAVNLQADCSDQAGMADVVVRNLSIRAAKITPVK